LARLGWFYRSNDDDDIRGLVKQRWRFKFHRRF